jgi:hypothetical protein
MKRNLLAHAAAITLFLLPVSLYAQFVPAQPCNFLRKVGGSTSSNGAEISAFDAASKRVYTVAGPVIEYYTLGNTGTLTSGGILPAGFAVPAGANALPNSVAVHNGLLAASFAIVNTTTNAQQPGQVAFYNAATGAFLKAVTVGYLPDMLVFTPDGKKLLTANEGEPNGYNQPASFDPEGSVSVVNLSAGVESASVQTASFAGFNGQIASLRSAGVRIFGPGATVAQDLEPEYIAISPDGTKAWVTLQENNAFATVDIASATVTQIIPLGLKDHSKPSVQSVQKFDFNNLNLLGTTSAGQNIQWGGFSGLHFEGYAPNGNMKFLTHSDRGPNGEPTGIFRPFMLPGFAPEILRFELNPSSGQIVFTQRLSLKVSPTKLLTGLPNISVSNDPNLPYNDEVPVDLYNDPINPPDPFGADLEGIIAMPDGSFWMVDEYRPAIYHFAADGVMIERFVPAGTAAAAGKPAGTYGTETLPAVIAQRRQNRGFEAVAYQNGKLYAFVQSPLRNPASLSNTVLNGLKNIRIVEFDPVTKTTTAQYIYIMDNKPATPGSLTDTRADKIGDAVAIGNSEFLVIERDDDAIDSDPLNEIEKKIYRFNLAGATNVNSLPNLVNGKTLDQMTAAELVAAGVTPITKYLHVDLATAGYNTVEKIEGLTLIDRNTLAVINDNDFGVAGTVVDTIAGTFSPYPNPNMEKPVLGLIRLQNNGLDASDRDLTSNSGRINIQHWPVFGMYQPDAIAQYTVGNKTYYVTVNEGDARDWPGFAEEIRVGANGYVPDSATFPNRTFLKNNANLGRLQLTAASGDLDGDGDIDRIQALGARSFSVWDSNGQLIFDSGDEMEQITAALSAASFNSDGTAASFDTRSDNKGPEPEGIVIGIIDNVPYAFIGMERTGDILVYDMSNPLKPVFIQYINTPEDQGVEGLAFVPAANSPTGKPLLITSAEVSRTVAIFEVNVPTIQVTENSGLVNNDGTICTGAAIGLTATGGAGSYVWNNGSTDATIWVTPQMTTTYSVKSCGLTGTRTITVNPATACTVKAVPFSLLNTGGNPNNIYLGYAHQRMGLFVDVPESGAPYKFAWSGGALSDYDVQFPIFTATEPGRFTYTVHVTNKYGCVSSCSITICVTDVRVPGTNGAKVYVCHNGGTLELNVADVAAHMENHPGDRLGRCDQAPCSSPVVTETLITRLQPATVDATAYPNPSANYFTLQVRSAKVGPVEVRVTDMHGRRMYTKQGVRGTLAFGHDFVRGTYIVEVIQDNRKQILKLVKQ